jgi:hypothetical protein
MSISCIKRVLSPQSGYEPLHSKEVMRRSRTTQHETDAEKRSCSLSLWQFQTKFTRCMRRFRPLAWYIALLALLCRATFRSAPLSSTLWFLPFSHLWIVAAWECLGFYRTQLDQVDAARRAIANRAHHRVRAPFTIFSRLALLVRRYKPTSHRVIPGPERESRAARRSQERSRGSGVTPCPLPARLVGSGRRC